MPLTQEEQNKGLLSFQNEVVDPTGQNRGVGGSVIRRYTAPTAPTASPTTTPTITPVTSSASNPIADYYNDLNKPFTPNDEATIRENTRKSMQSQIDAINAEFNTLTAQESAAQDKLAQNSAGQTRAISARSGLLGSDFGAAHIQNDAGNSAKAKSASLKVLEDERQVRIQSILGNIEARASEEIKARKAEALGNREKYVQHLEQTQEQARNDLKTLAQAGGNLDVLSPAQKEAILKQSGYEPSMGELIFNSLKPKPEQIDYQFANLGNGKALFYGTDPATGQLKQQTIETSNPQADLIIGIITKYPDAGITLEDDLATAQQKIQNSKIYRDQVRPPVNAGKHTTPTTTTDNSNTPDPKGNYPSSSDVKNWIYENKKANPNVDYYDLWGQLAEQLKSEGLNPENYDQAFWEILHPEGLEGYKKYNPTTKSNSSSSPSSKKSDREL